MYIYIYIYTYIYICTCIYICVYTPRGPGSPRQPCRLPLVVATLRLMVLRPAKKAHVLCVEMLVESVSRFIENF